MSLAETLRILVRSAHKAVAVLLAAMFVSSVAWATSPAATQPGTPPQVIEIIRLLEDPAVRAWVAANPAATKAPPSAPLPSDLQSPGSFVETRLAAIESHVRTILQSIPRLPEELRTALGRLAPELSTRGPVSFLLAVLAFLASGFVLERAFGWAMIFARRSVQAGAAPPGSFSHRMRNLGFNLGQETGAAIAFGLGALGAVLLLDLPPMVRQVAIGYLIALLALRIAVAVLRVMLVPGTQGTEDERVRLRAMPLSDAAARFWFRRLALLIGWFAFAWTTLVNLVDLGLPREPRLVLAYALGIGLVVIALEMVWRRPLPAASERRMSGVLLSWVATAVILLLWHSWVMSGFRFFWLVVVVAGLPLAISIGRRTIRYLFRSDDAVAEQQADASVAMVCAERGFNAVMLVVAAWLLLRSWNVDLGAIVGAETAGTRLLRGAFHAFIILLVADFCWHLVKAVIDKALLSVRNSTTADRNELQRQARIRTLLPIFQNIMFVVLLVMGIMMALAALGVEIGPLIASAGVVGVAVGFGAQTLVRDVFSGIFYLLDDAFRVGEYIQSGSYKGTVESFSLRSIKLRHQRGPLFTVPFGELGAIQNMSRDWVIDKMTISIDYASDFDKAKKLIKQIGRELAEAPEHAQDIIEPLKMQGVEEFGDYGIKIRLKIMTRPGKQFVIRRRANVMIKKAFDANGIHFAMPVVQVAGGEDGAATAARASVAVSQIAERKAEAPA